jgi:2-oxoglutarate ferredoxin oxidoreductase subunit gamma
LIKPGGVLVVNESMVNREPVRKDIKVVRIPASDLAEELGDRRMTNMVMLGGLLANLPVMGLDAMEKTLKEHLPAKLAKLLDANKKALSKGAEFKV